MSADAAADLLERAKEVDEILDLLDRATQGRGGLLAFEGAAGIGKSRLLAAAIEAAHERGMTVTRARGGSLEQEFAFGAARQLLEPLVVAGDPAQVFSGAAAAAAPVLGHGVANAASDPGSVLHGLYWVTANAAESRPLALICDDAHWFDSPSLRFLAYLARRVDELPIAVIVGTRPPTSTGPEADLLGRLLTDPAGRPRQAVTALGRRGCPTRSLDPGRATRPVVLPGGGRSQPRQPVPRRRAHPRRGTVGHHRWSGGRHDARRS